MPLNKLKLFFRGGASSSLETFFWGGWRQWNGAALKVEGKTIKKKFNSKVKNEVPRPKYLN